jgi:type II secretory pathway pseudopilin PulG
MNAITISLLAIVLAAALAGVAPASRFVQREAATFQAHEAAAAPSAHQVLT